jgi:hypothetical protein
LSGPYTGAVHLHPLGRLGVLREIARCSLDAGFERLVVLSELTNHGVHGRRYFGCLSFGQIYGYPAAVFRLGSGSGPWLKGWLVDVSVYPLNRFGTRSRRRPPDPKG